MPKAFQGLGFISGTNAERLAHTVGVAQAGTQWFETDTSAVYVWSGSAWFQSIYSGLTPASGDLTGSYPNPTIAPSIATNLKIANAAPTMTIAETGGAGQAALQLLQNGSTLASEGAEFRYNSATGHTYLRSSYSGGNLYLGAGSSSAQQVSIEPGGRLSLPYQPAFSGRRVAGSVTGGVFVANVAAINRGNHYNTSNGIFTCPVAGAYYMGFQGIAASSPGYGYIRAYKNGINQGMFAHYNLNAGSWNTPSLNAIINCAVNDQLTFVVETIAGNGGFYGSEHNTQSIMFLG